MIKQIEIITYAAAAALLLATLALPAHAGTVTIYNENCTKTYNFSTKKRVRVRVHSPHCTDKKVSVRQGHSETVVVQEKYKTRVGGWFNCEGYRHEAMGTKWGKPDAPPDGDTHVTCKKDWLGVCQCTKD